MDAEAARGTEQGRGHRRAADGPRGTGPRSRERVGAARLREASAGQGHWCPRGAGREGAPGRPGRAVRGSVPRLRLNDRLGQRQGSPWHDDGSRRARDSGQGVDRPRGHRRGLESRRHAAGMHVVDAPRRGHRSQEDGTESWSRSSNANSPRNPSATGAGSWATI
ncbi:hypothetical protein DFJ74DRAFT_684852 [Hyaloraphidium curvatum]|nr:hypothetical protein DFJ74DRAFT_684852 [Hyaloraphidium curvatum]